MNQTRFTPECAVSIVAGAVAWIVQHHPTLSDVQAVANAIIVVGMALTTTYTSISATAKFVGWARGKFEGKKESP